MGAEIKPIFRHLLKNWQILKTHWFCFEKENDLLVWTNSKNFKYFILLICYHNWHLIPSYNLCRVSKLRNTLKHTQAHPHWCSFVVLCFVFAPWRRGGSEAMILNLERKKLRLRWLKRLCQDVGAESKTNLLLGSFYLFYFIAFFFFFFFFFFRAAPSTHGSSQARQSNESCSCRPTPQPQQCRIQAVTATHTTAHGNTRSLTHWARPGIEPITSWFRVGFVSAVPWWELQVSIKFYWNTFVLIYLHTAHSSLWPRWHSWVSVMEIVWPLRANLYSLVP